MRYVITMKRIEHYDNYRDFLRDWFEDRKKRFRFFSNRYFCQKAGIKSPSLFKEVVNGNRNLTEQSIPKFIRGMGLTDSDAAFFRILVHLNQAQDPKEREIYTEELKKFRDKVVKEVIPAEHYEYYSRWYHPVVRELSCLVDWKDDFRYLASLITPQVKTREVKESVAMLIRLGFLVKGDDGLYYQSAPSITSGSHVHAAGVRDLNRHFTNLGSEAIDRFSQDDRYVSSMTVGISKEAYDSLRQEIEEFRDRVRRIVFDDNGSDRVYSMNMQLFPLSDREEK